MKILYYIAFAGKNILMDRWQQFHIFDELSKHNCFIEVFNPLDFNTVDEANERLISYINSNSFDLFMTPHESQLIFIETIVKIKQKGLPTLLICFDNLIIPYNHRDICKYFDLVWLTSQETEHMFKKWGAKHIIFNPYAANPHFFKPRYEDEIKKVSFIGTPYGSRVNMINLLIENKVNVSLHAPISLNSHDSRFLSNKQPLRKYLYPGYEFMKFKIGRKIILGAIKQKMFGTGSLNIDNNYLDINPPADLHELNGLYSNYAISLSSTCARNTGVLKKPVHIVNLRSFEIPMCGGLQICSYFKELEMYFEEDKEIIFYRTNEELVEKSKFYLKSENKYLRMKMKEAARRRAENEHTWLCRFKKVFDFFGLNYK